MAEQFGGNLTISSERTKGTTVTISLALANIGIGKVG
jgi:signal transduction histidine kinase